MQTRDKESPVVQRTLELCHAITQQEDFQSLKTRFDAFFADELLKFKFQQLNQLGQILQMKQEGGVEIKEEEISQFESLRDEVMGNSIATEFLDAQKELQQLHQMVDRYLDRTFELGRKPEYEDIHDGSCGNCDCHS